MLWEKNYIGKIIPRDNIKDNNKHAAIPFTVKPSRTVALLLATG